MCVRDHGIWEPWELRGGRHEIVDWSGASWWSHPERHGERVRDVRPRGASHSARAVARPRAGLRRAALQSRQARRSHRHRSVRRRARSSPRWEARRSTSTTRHRATCSSPARRQHQRAYTAGTAFDAKGNLYVTDDTTGNISEYSPTGAGAADLRLGTGEPAVAGLRQQRQPLRRTADRRRTSPSSTRAGSARPTSARSPPSRRRRLDRPGERRVHLLLHHRGHRHPALQQVHQPPRLPELQPGAVPVGGPHDGQPSRPTNSRSWPTATSSWPTPTPTSCSTPNGNVIQTYPCSLHDGLRRRALRHQRRPQRHLLLDR